MHLGGSYRDNEFNGLIAGLVSINIKTHLVVKFADGHHLLATSSNWKLFDVFLFQCLFSFIVAFCVCFFSAVFYINLFPTAVTSAAFKLLAFAGMQLICSLLLIVIYPLARITFNNVH